MPPTGAMIGYGSKFEISTDAGVNFVEMEEVFNLTPPTDEIDLVEATHMRSPDATKEYILGLRDAGEASMEMNYIPGSTTDLALVAIRDSRVSVQARITFPNGVTLTFTGLLTTYAPAAPTDDRMTATLTFKVSGTPVAGAEAAPVNSAIPAISGIAQVGQVLTALEGTWSGIPDYTYQWQAAGVDITGETGKTLTLAAGQLGDAITVDVTGTNGAGNATASSGPTADVIAA